MEEGAWILKMSRREDEIAEANRNHYPKWWWEVSDEDDDVPCKHDGTGWDD